MKKLLHILFILSSVLVVQSQIIDHRYTNVEDIPFDVINSVKENMKLQWCGQSHSHQIATGLMFLEEDFSDLDVTTNTDGNVWLPEPNGTLCMMDGISGFNKCGHCCMAYIYPEAYWADASAFGNVETTLIDCYPSINVSGFLWCDELEGASEDYVQAYLDTLTAYDERYPDVTFVRTTCQAQGSGDNGYNRWLRNEQIRQHCIDNNKVLFDFADLDAWSNNDFSYYIYNGDTIPLEHPDYYGDIYHTNELGNKNKARAIWYMLAILEGWNPESFNLEAWKAEAGNSGSNLTTDYNNDGQVDNQDKNVFEE